MSSLHYLQTVLKKKETPAFIIAVCLAFFYFPIFFEAPVFPIPNSGAAWLTLDPSWQLTLSEINHDHLNWGDDFILTYGPLSYLCTRIGWGMSRYYFLLFDLFVWLNLFYILYSNYLKSENKILTILLLAATTLLFPINAGGGASLVLLAVLLFWIRESFREQKPLFYCMQLVITVLLFFMKFNTGFIAIMFFLISILYPLVFKKEKKGQYLFYAAFLFVLIFLFSVLLNVSLAPYIKGGLNMISGHNEIMYLDDQYEQKLLSCLVIILLAVITLILKFNFEKKEMVKNLITLFLFSVGLYILYKQGFVRADLAHVLDFYRYVLLFMICFSDFNNRRNALISGLLTIIIIAVAICSMPDKVVFTDLHYKIKKTGYFTGFMQFNDTSGLHLFPNDNQIPQRIKDRIGKNSVDVYPWNSGLLIENKLNYKPRPVFQSYIAYTPYLEDLNFKFYNSNKAPDYVLYEYEAIDARYPLFDEPKLNLILLKNYSCVDTFRFAQRPVLVLKKNKTTAVQLQKIKEYQLTILDSIVPKPDIFYELSVFKSFSGKLVSLAKHAPELTFLIKTKTGSSYQYRTSIPLLQSGIFDQYAITSTNDFYDLLKNDSLPVAARVSWYKLQPTNRKLFNDKITVMEYRIN